MGKARGQMSVLGGAYIQMDYLINKLVKQASYFFLLKGTRLSVWSVSTSLPLIMKQSTKFW